MLKVKDQEASQAKMWLLAIILPVVLPIPAATAFNNRQRCALLKARTIHLQQLSTRPLHAIFPPANDSASTINTCLEPLFAKSDDGGDGAADGASQVSQKGPFGEAPRSGSAVLRHELAFKNMSATSGVP